MEECELCETKLEDNRKSIFLRLPVELLVYIISFLPTIRDLVKLRYVCQRLRVASETPTLWCEFMWPLFDPQEENSAKSVLKACGAHIKRMAFPDHVRPSTLFEMLSHCSKITQLFLPVETELDSEQLRTAVRHMKNLEKLEMQLCSDIKPLLHIRELNDLTVHVPQQYHSLCSQWLLEWMKKSFVPCHLNLVADFGYEMEGVFLQSLLQWNFTPLVGKTSYFKHYTKLRSPLNLYPPIPVFQLVIGQTIVLPLVKPSSFGIFLDWDMATLTDCIFDGKVVCKADTGVYNFFRDAVLNKVVIDNLNCVTEFNFAYSETLQSGNLEQVAVACPNLQRLNLENNVDCLHPLKGLRMIASNCCNLRGLSVRCISVTYIESQLGLWDIVSRMRLTDLVADVCVLQSNSNDVQLIGFFQKCSTLQALQLESFYDDDICGVCAHGEVKWSMLSHFPSLKYCYLPGNHPYLVQDIISSCKELAVLRCEPNVSLLISSAFTSSLQQLYIQSHDTNIPDMFMETVSAHGRLLHVVLLVNSISIQGIIILIRNSPELLSLAISASNIMFHKYGYPEITEKDNLRDSLQKKFPNRKLFRVGKFTVGHGFSEILTKTDLLPLWPLYI